MIDQLLREHFESLTGDFVILEEAERFLKLMDEQHPEELKKWLDSRALDFIAQALRTMAKSERAISRHRAGAREFQNTVSVFAATDNRQALEQHYVVTKDNLWRKLRDMTKDDLGFVADQYEIRGKQLLRWGAYFRHLQSKVAPGQVLADVLTEEQVEAIQQRFFDVEQ